MKSGERKLSPLHPHPHPPPHLQLPWTQTRRGSPLCLCSRLGDTPKLPPPSLCMLPFVVSMIVLLPCHNLEQGDPPWVATHTHETLHKTAHVLERIIGDGRN
jgi:hypothetical protein